MNFKHCNKCNRTMKKVIRYKNNYKIIEHICPVHGIEKFEFIMEN